MSWGLQLNALYSTEKGDINDAKDAPSAYWRLSARSEKKGRNSRQQLNRVKFRIGFEIHVENIHWIKIFPKNNHMPSKQ